MVQKIKHKTKRLRSPNYPAFPLEDAMGKAKILYDKDGKTGAHRSVVLNHLGFKSESGSSLRNLSTLKIFGLTSEKNRHIMLTQPAIDSIIYSYDKDKTSQLRKEIALNPNIYIELYDKYPDGFPSDDAIKAELLSGYNFNPKVIDLFIINFRLTMEYAGLSGGRKEIVKGTRDIREREIEEIIPEQDIMRNAQTGASPIQTGQSYQIPSGEITLVFNKFPVQKEALEKLKKWLDLFEDDLTREEGKSDPVTELIKIPDE